MRGNCAVMILSMHWGLSMGNLLILAWSQRVAAEYLAVE
jgi:hypothetical protein